MPLTDGLELWSSRELGRELGRELAREDADIASSVKCSDAGESSWSSRRKQASWCDRERCGSPEFVEAPPTEVVLVGEFGCGSE